MLVLLLDFSGFSAFFEVPEEDDEFVETEAPDDAETDVRMLFDFFNEMPEDEGQSGFSRHSSGLNDEKSARIPLSVWRKVFLAKNFKNVKIV